MIQLALLVIYHTGGGFYENVPRMLKEGMGVEIDTKAFPKPPIFDLIQKNGDISTKEMYNVFNMGLGYQHFGLVLAMKNGKIFVVPMSGNSSAYHRAYDPVSHMGKRHLMRLPEIEGLNKASVLFLNDAKWINSARVIDVKAHIDPNSHLFDKIKKCVMQMML